MNEIILFFKKDLENKTSFCINIKNKQENIKIKIEKAIEDIEILYFALLEKKISLIDFEKFIKTDVRKVIFDNKLTFIIETLAKLKEGQNLSFYFERFNNNICYLISDLNTHLYDKERNIISLEYEIIKRKNLLSKIDSTGKLTKPLDLDDFELINNFIEQADTSKIELLTEINLENAKAIERQIYTKKKKKKIPTVLQSEQEKPKQLSQDQKNIYEQAKTIINNQNINELTQIEKTYTDLLNEITSLKEFNELLEISDENEIKEKLIIIYMNSIINNITNENIIEKIEILKECITIYKKIQMDLQEEIEERKKKQAHFNSEIKKFEQICNEIDDDDEIIQSLTQKQINYLESFKNNVNKINNDKELKDEIDDTLKNVDLNITFLLLYEIITKLQKNIIEFKEDPTINNHKLLNNIIQLYNLYKEAKENYIKSTEKTIEKDNTRKENILIYLTNENITYAEDYILDSSNFNPNDVEGLIETLNHLRINTPSVIHAKARKVKPETKNCKKRRYRQSDYRIIYSQINQEIINSDSPVFLIITAGIKDNNDDKIYRYTNSHTKEIDAFLEKYNKLKNNPKEIKAFLEKNKQIEKELFEHLNQIKKERRK